MLLDKSVEYYDPDCVDKLEDLSVGYQSTSKAELGVMMQYDHYKYTQTLVTSGNSHTDPSLLQSLLVNAILRRDRVLYN